MSEGLLTFWQELSPKLYEPFKESEIKTFGPNVGAKKGLRYIDSRNVVQRLDSVCPGQWSFEIPETIERQVNGKLVIAMRGRLTVCGVTRECWGESEAGFGEPYKSAASDALKRAAVRFGVGAHLYSDETPTSDAGVKIDKLYKACYILSGISGTWGDASQVQKDILNVVQNGVVDLAGVPRGKGSLDAVQEQDKELTKLVIEKALEALNQGKKLTSVAQANKFVEALGVALG